MIRRTALAFSVYRWFAGIGHRALLCGIVLGGLGATAAQAQPASSAPGLSPLSIGRDALGLLPVDKVSDLLGLRAGAFPLFGRDYRMRAGGRGDELLVVDGVPVRNQTFGLTLLNPALSGFEGVELDASIADVTLPGAAGGAVRVRSVAAESGIDGVVRVTTEELMPDWSLGANRLDANAAGRLGSAFRFSAALNAQGNKSSPFTSNLKGIPLYTMVGVDTTIIMDFGAGPESVDVPRFERSGEAGRIPYSARDDYGAQLRVAYEPGERTSISGGIYVSRTQSRDPFGASCNCAAFLPTSQNGTFARSRLASLTLEHTVSDALRVRAYAAHASDRFQSGALDPAFAVDQRKPSFGFTTTDFEFLVDPEQYRVNEELIKRVLANDGPRTPFPFDRTDLNPGARFRFSPYGDYQFITRGVAGRHEYADEKRLSVGVSAEYTAGRHRLDAGVDGSRTDARLIDVRYNNLDGLDLFVEQPVQYGAFMRDRISLGRVLVDLGARVDYFHSGAHYGAVPGYRGPQEPAVAADAITAISPQAGATYLHDERTTLAARFARAARVPDLRDQFVNINSDFFRFRNTSTDAAFATPLSLITADVFEFAFGRVLGGSVFELAAFRNRQSGMPVLGRERIEDPTVPGVSAMLHLMRNAGEQTVDGATIRLGSAVIEERGWSLAYTVATSDGEVANVPVKADPLSELPMRAELAAPGDTWHTLNGFIATDLGALGSSELLRRTSVGATAVIASPVHIRGISLANPRTDWLTQLDLRLQYTLPFAGNGARIVVDMRNLLGSTRGFDTSALHASALEGLIESHRAALGGGFAEDAIDLRTYEGWGIRYEADRAALLQTERRFGNGDAVFTRDEQVAAFTEAARFYAAAGLPGSPGRRLRVGVSVDF